MSSFWIHSLKSDFLSHNYVTGNEFSFINCSLCPIPGRKHRKIIPILYRMLEKMPVPLQPRLPQVKRQSSDRYPRSRFGNHLAFARTQTMGFGWCGLERVREVPLFLRLPRGFLARARDVCVNFERGLSILVGAWWKGQGIDRPREARGLMG